MPALNREDIQKLLPHRPPFLMIDEVIEWVSGQSIIASKYIDANEYYFQGHFPGFPVMPGVLILEAFAQTAGVLAYLSEGKQSQDHLFYLATIEKAKFRQLVLPGTKLQLEVNFVSSKNRFVKFDGKAFVDGKLVCDAALMSAKALAIE